MLSTIFRQITIAQFDISGSVDPLLSVTLNKGKSLFAESNAMVAMDGTLSLSGRTKGGFFKTLARKFLNDETFFQQKITAEDEGGRALLGNSGGLFVMATEGEGRVAVSGFGSVRRIDIADGQSSSLITGTSSPGRSPLTMSCRSTHPARGFWANSSQVRPQAKGLF